MSPTYLKSSCIYGASNSPLTTMALVPQQCQNEKPDKQEFEQKRLQCDANCLRPFERLGIVSNPQLSLFFCNYRINSKNCPKGDIVDYLLLVTLKVTSIKCHERRNTLMETERVSISFGLSLTLIVKMNNLPSLTRHAFHSVT